MWRVRGWRGGQGRGSEGEKGTDTDLAKICNVVLRQSGEVVHVLLSGFQEVVLNVVQSTSPEQRDEPDSKKGGEEEIENYLPFLPFFVINKARENVGRVPSWGSPSGKGRERSGSGSKGSVLVARAQWGL